MPYAGGAGLNKQKVCLEGTREELLKEICDWINDTEEDTPRIFWLHGPAGTGKSSIAHTLLPIGFGSLNAWARFSASIAAG